MNFWKVVFGYLSALGIVFGTEYTALTFAPLSYWVEYQNVQILPPVNPGGPVRVLSTFQRHQTANMVYNDTLYCADGAGDYATYSVQAGEISALPPFNGSRQWKYTAPVPRQGQCFLRSAVTVQLKYGIRPKPQVLISNIVNIGNNHGN